MDILTGFNLLVAVSNVIKIDDKKERNKKIRELEDFAFNNNNVYLALRLAFEFQHYKLSIKRIQNYIIKHQNARVIYRFAHGIDNADISRLEDAIIATGDLEEISRFGCFIDGANKERIGDIIAASNNAKAVYLYHCFARSYPFEKLKHITIRSKRPRYLYQLAKLTTDESDLDVIQELILAGRSLMYCRLFCKHIKRANIKEFEDKVIRSKDINQIRAFAKEVPGADRARVMMLLV